MDLPSGIVTFLITDIEGSTSLARGLGEAYSGLLEEHRRLIREVSADFDARLDAARRVEPVRGFGGQVGVIRRATGPG